MQICSLEYSPSTSNHASIIGTYLYFFKWAIPGLFYHLFLAFSNKQTLQCLQQMWTNVHLVSSAEIRIHNLLDISPPINTKPGLPPIILILAFIIKKTVGRPWRLQCQSSWIVDEDDDDEQEEALLMFFFVDGQNVLFLFLILNLSLKFGVWCDYRSPPHTFSFKMFPDNFWSLGGIEHKPPASKLFQIIL